jgi:hypothetical protein
MQLKEDGLLNENDLYTWENIREFGLWNLIFWVIVFLVHFICGLVLDSPSDLWGVLFGIVIQVHFLNQLCWPVESEGQRSISSSNMNITGVLCGYFIIFHNMPLGLNNRYIVAFCLLFFDYFLCIGHMWDNAPKLGTVTNCRLFYVGFAPICLAALYGAWNDPLLHMH